MTTFVLLLTLLAQNADFETRYHDAYVLEVVDGKVADAARRYLELLGDPDVPKHLAVQCRFRFAVTCVLLGRADEARARLASLAADPDTPETLKPQIEEYRKALRDVDPGRELDKTLDELRMKLANATPGGLDNYVKGVYREWQVIGKPAVPYLTKLLDHPDDQLRAHAFVLLCKLDVPRMPERWRPEFGAAARPFEQYLRRNPDEVHRMEVRLRGGLHDNVLGPWLAQLRTVRFSKDFLQRLEDRNIAIRLVPMTANLETADARRLLDHWIRQRGKGGRPDLARAAAESYVANPSFPPAGLLGPICLLLAPRKLAPATSKGIFDMAKAVDPAARMRVLGELVAAGEEDPAVLLNGLADIVASAVDRDEFDAKAYEALLRRWLAVLKEHRKHDNRFLGRHLRAALRKLPGSQAVAWVREIVRLDLPYADPFEYHDAIEVPWIVAALEVGDPDRRRAFAEQIIGSLEGATPLYRRGIAPLYPRLVALHEPGEMYRPLREFRHVATEIPDPAPAKGRLGTAARALALEVVDIVVNAGRSPEATANTLDNLFISDEGRDHATESRYLRNVAIPLLATLTERLATDAARRAFVAKAYDLLVEDAHGRWDLKGNREALRRYVADNFAHLDEVHAFEDVEPLLPPANWLPYADASVFRTLSKERRVAAARAFARAPGRITPELMDTLCGELPAEVGSEVVDVLLAQADAAQLHVIVGGLRDWRWGRADTLETVLARGLADPAYALADLAHVGELLAQARPTRKLYPLVERLLVSPEPGLAGKGIEMAASLGQPDLLPALAKLLDSLDPTVRTAAQDAMTAIAELERLRREARTELGTGDEE